MGYLTTLGIPTGLLDQTDPDTLGTALARLCRNSHLDGPAASATVDVDGQVLRRGATSHSTQVVVFAAGVDRLELTLRGPSAQTGGPWHTPSGRPASPAEIDRALTGDGTALRYADSGDRRQLRRLHTSGRLPGGRVDAGQLDRHGIAGATWPAGTDGQIVFGLYEDHTRQLDQDGWTSLAGDLAARLSHRWGPQRSGRHDTAIVPCALVTGGTVPVVAYHNGLFLHDRMRTVDPAWDTEIRTAAGLAPHQRPAVR